MNECSRHGIPSAVCCGGEPTVKYPSVAALENSEWKRLQGIEQRLKECMEQRHGDRYGSLWMDTFRFILTGEKQLP